jgi:DNA-binding response OmpR family regulator
MNVVLVEDDTRVADFLKRGLGAEGYTVAVALSGKQGLALIKDANPQLAILDLMLPEMSGLEICQELRAARMRVPILMLTAMGTTEDKVTGLRMGADDYLTKPFAFDELLARMEALLRRGAPEHVPSQLIVLGDLSFNRETLEVRRGERAIELTAKELTLLELLMSAPGKVFSRARILNTVWGLSSDPLTNVVDVYIRRLRVKLDDGREPSMIQTNRGFGYKIIDPDAR